MTVKLSASTLDKWPNAFKTPRFRRGDLKPGILHIGLGSPSTSTTLRDCLTGMM